MTQKHTPGPWRVFTRDFSSHLRFIYSSNGRVLPLARIEPIPSKYAVTESIDANARLIAAAPDLLEALKGCIGWIETSSEGEAATVKALAAIAKAEGKHNVL